MERPKSKNRESYGWGPQSDQASDYHAYATELESLRASQPAQLITKRHCDEFHNAFNDVASMKNSRDYAKRIIECADDYFSVVYKTPVKPTSFIKFCERKAHDEWLERRPNGTLRLKRLTTHDDFLTLWDIFKAWQAARFAHLSGEAPRSDYGWFPHGVRFLARLARWVLTDRSAKVNFIKPISVNAAQPVEKKRANTAAADKAAPGPVDEPVTVKKAKVAGAEGK